PGSNIAPGGDDIAPGSNVHGDDVVNSDVVTSGVSEKIRLDNVRADTASLTTVDEETLGRVQQALSTSGVFALRELTVNWVEDKLCLSGTVGSFYHKQLAQETVRAVAGAVEVVNSVRVSSVR